MCAGLAVNSGLSVEEGWKAVTINPATALGISDRVGSLEAGKDADIVVFDDDINIESVFVMGNKVN